MRGPYILGFIAKSQGYGDAKAKESRVCTRIVSTGLEGIKQHEIITIRGNRVRAGQVPMLAIDMVLSVFWSGLFRVVCGQEETTLEDAEGCDDNWSCFRFHQGWTGEVGCVVMEMMLSSIAPGSDQD